MAIVYTGKGTSAGVGANQNINNVTVNAGELLVVGAGDRNVAPNSIKWGSDELVLVPDTRIEDSVNGLASSMYALIAQETRTKTIFGAWPAAAGATAIVASTATETSQRDVIASALSAATGAPDTSSAGNSGIADSISFAFHVSQGPNTDTPGTAGSGHTLGQRVGTVGANSITIQETYEILSAVGTIQSTLSGATSRDWASTIAAFRATQTYTVVDAYENLRTTDNDAHNIIVRLESETTADYVEVRLSPSEFDDLTDAQVTERFLGAAAWHAAQRINANLPVPEADATRNTRLATFINDTVKV